MSYSVNVEDSYTTFGENDTERLIDFLEDYLGSSCKPLICWYKLLVLK